LGTFSRKWLKKNPSCWDHMVVWFTSIHKELEIIWYVCLNEKNRRDDTLLEQIWKWLKHQIFKTFIFLSAVFYLCKFDLRILKQTYQIISNSLWIDVNQTTIWSQHEGFFLSHLRENVPKARESEIKKNPFKLLFSLFLGLSPQENFEIFNAKSYA
jgi:Fe2+ transport system protein B